MLTDAEKSAMRDATREAALVLVDDLAHIRKIVTKVEPSSGDVRRLSGLLRRILIYEDLRKVAVPRIGRVHLQSPDMRSLHRENERSPFQFAFADQVDTFGLMISLLMVQRNPNSPPGLPRGLVPGQYVSLSCDSFCKQRVICRNGAWLTRADIIKYVANVASGVHTGEPKGKDFLVREVRNNVSLTRGGGGVSVDFNDIVGALDDPPP